MNRLRFKLIRSPIPFSHNIRSISTSTTSLVSLKSLDPVIAFRNHLVNACKNSLKTPFCLSNYATLGKTRANNNEYYFEPLAKKVLIVGSGGLSIGQAGEFDYSGSQAIKALKEEGVETILINPNIATVQTGKDLADTVYFLPINAEYIEYVIKKERPDGILLTFGGQSALNCGIELNKLKVFEKYNVRVLGTPIRTLELSEDRDLFAKALKEIGIPTAESVAVESVEEALEAAAKIKYPIIVRSAYALGGLGSGFASNEQELRHLATKSLSLSPQILIERSMKGWKEVEYEVVRDAQDNCITVCNMENFNPLGVHTGDSIVVAPSQTLSDQEYHMLRTAAIKIIKHLGVVGECNVQYGLDPESLEYFVIEVNARLSRSSALASKATGYPLAFVAAKIGLGATLPQLKNAVTKTTTANFEPSLDYVVTKIPRWDLGKFQHVARDIGSSMKSVGEVMAIGRTFEESIQKAMRMVDGSFSGFDEYEISGDIDTMLKNPSDTHLLVIASAMIKHGYSVEDIHTLTKIDRWFLHKLDNIVNMRKVLAASDLDADLLLKAKQLGYSDAQIGKLVAKSEIEIRNKRREHGIYPRVKRIDTLAGEFPANTNYLYTSYNATTDDVEFEDNGIMVLGSGVYRIGSSVEFDWCAVSCIRSLKEMNLKTIMVNYNPETVSTDFDECDRLYFEELSLERVLDIYEREKSNGVIVSVGGQLPQNIALKLYENGVNVLGTSPVEIDRAEDRFKFSKALDDCHIKQPEWKQLTSIKEAQEFASKVGYPVLVRPSYVLSGAAMNVAYNLTELQEYLNLAISVSPEHPIVITKFIQNAQELDVDAVANNGQLLVYSVAQHVEDAGVHSGDATLVLPPTIANKTDTFENGVGLKGLNSEIINQVKEIASKIATEFKISGPFNIQIILTENELKVIECNLRSARSLPFVSKVLDLNFIDVATRSIINHPSLMSVVPTTDLMTIPRPFVAVKSPVFSWTRLAGADPMLGVEMASTGEVACFGRDVTEAFFTSYLSNHNNFKELPIAKDASILLTMDNLANPSEILYIAKTFNELGHVIYTDTDTSSFLSDNEIPNTLLHENLAQVLSNRKISRDLFSTKNIKMVFSICKTRPKNTDNLAYMIRRSAVDFGIGLVNEPKTAVLLTRAVKEYTSGRVKSDAVKSWQEFMDEGVQGVEKKN